MERERQGGVSVGLSFQHLNGVTLSPIESHFRAVVLATRKSPPDWKRHLGRPSHTWLRVIESDLSRLNIHPSYVCKNASSREHWS